MKKFVALTLLVSLSFGGFAQAAYLLPWRQAMDARLKALEGNGPQRPAPSVPVQPQSPIYILPSNPQVLPIAPNPQVLPLVPNPQVLPIAPNPQPLPIAPNPQPMPVAPNPQVIPMIPKPPSATPGAPGASAPEMQRYSNALWPVQ